MSVQSIDRAVDILSLFSTETTRMGITDIARSLGLSKTTVHGLARTLLARGMLRQDERTRKYGLGMKIFELGAMLNASLKINRVGLGAAQRLADVSGFNAQLALWQQPVLLLTATACPGLPGALLGPMGLSVPLHCTATGKAVLMALEPAELRRFLDQRRMNRLTPNTITDRQALERQLAAFRRQGFAEETEEFLPGMCCRAAPLWELGGALAGALSVSAVPGQFDGRQGLTRQLVAAAAEITRAMGGVVPALADRDDI